DHLGPGNRGSPDERPPLATEEEHLVERDLATRLDGQRLDAHGLARAHAQLFASDSDHGVHEKLPFERCKGDTLKELRMIVNPPREEVMVQFESALGTSQRRRAGRAERPSARALSEGDARPSPSGVRHASARASGLRKPERACTPSLALCSDCTM